jgi:hypothetical protein
MKMKIMHVVKLSVLGAFLMTAGAALSQEVPEQVTMDSKIYETHKNGLVTFSHKKHSDEYKVACADCHHIYDGGKNTWKQGDVVQKCAVCHKDTGTPEQGMSKKEKIAKFHKEAIHANCVECHKTVNKDGKAAPIACKDCHPKK